MFENTAQFADYRHNMAELTACLGNLCRMENRMIAAASEENTEEMDAIVQELQPDYLKFRSLEKKRAALEASLGIQGRSFTEVLAACTEEQRTELSPVYDALRRELHAFEQARSNADLIMRTRLFDINLALTDVPKPEPFRETRA